MKPRIHVLTLAVDDLERSLAFYRKLGLESPGVVATEFPGDEENAAGDIVTFQLDRGFILAVYPRTSSPRTQRSLSHRRPPGYSASGTQ